MKTKMKTTAVTLASICLLASAQMAQAALYNVTGVFNEPQTQTGHTTFVGTFDWDATTNTLSGLQGSMNQTMYPNMMSGPLPDLYLMHQLDFNYDAATGDVVATVFKENSTDVFFNGGYTAGGSMKYGMMGMHGHIPKENAYFTLAFNANTMLGNVDAMVYGDCTPGGLMGPMMTGNMCMTGHSMANVGYLGTMDGNPISLSVSAVPVPAAAWLFGSGLLGLVGIARLKRKAA